MRSEEASKTAAVLTRQASKLGLTGPDGSPITFKVTHTKGVNDYGVKAVEMVEKVDFVTKESFWIDKDAPAEIDPSTEVYHNL